MIQIASVRVRTLTTTSLLVSWELAPTTEDVWEYDFYLLRAEADYGPYSQIAGPFRDQYDCLDSSVFLNNKFQRYFYKVRVVHVKSGNEETYPTDRGGALEAEPDRVTLEQARLLYLQLAEFEGRRVYYVPVRVFGTGCHCYDRLTGRKLVSSCRQCYDTSYLGGYHSPVEIYAKIQQSPMTVAETPGKTAKNIQAIATIANFPKAKPKDLIVEPENRRWRVLSVRLYEKLRSTWRQDLTVEEIPPGDVEYAFPIDVALKDLAPSPYRQFTNPRSFDGVEEAVKGVLKAYS